MIKYELIPAQLLHEGVITPEQLFAPELLDESSILLTHTTDYWHQLFHCTLDHAHIRRIGFPLTPLLVERERIISRGTIECAMWAMKYGVALNIAGGTHHAFADKGEGFCLLNDFAIAANYLLHRKLVERILILDLDVHQGNGTASLFAKKSNVFTFSMHGRHNYPFRKELSDLDIELEDGTNDETYLGLLQRFLPPVLDDFRPDIVFYLSGVDILLTDKYGKLNVSQEACAQRDAIVFKLCRDAKVPVVAAMGGGYSPKIADIVNAHCNTFKEAMNIFF